jgi:hypothetical protein
MPVNKRAPLLPNLLLSAGALPIPAECSLSENKKACNSETAGSGLKVAETSIQTTSFGKSQSAFWPSISRQGGVSDEQARNIRYPIKEILHFSIAPILSRCGNSLGGMFPVQ